MAYNQTTAITNGIRQAFRAYPLKKTCLSQAVSLTEKGPRGGAMCYCSKCGLAFPMRDVQVDHIEPVVPLERPIKDWNEYIDRLYCDLSNLQVLCKPCHQIKCNREKEIRADSRRSILDA